jgi:GNAT superfamily N-acetyltransferase
MIDCPDLPGSTMITTARRVHFLTIPHEMLVIGAGARCDADAVHLAEPSPTDPALADLLPVLRELRPHLDLDLLRAIYAEGHPQGLRFTGAYDDTGTCVAVAGWRIVATTVAVRRLYVDDLVTSDRVRSQGYGAALLRHLRAIARDSGCTALELDSGTHRAQAHRFYFREGLAISSFHFRETFDQDGL